jgi:hypothetical protein
MRRFHILSGGLLTALVLSSATHELRSQEPKTLPPDLLPPTTIGGPVKVPMPVPDAPIVPVAAAATGRKAAPFDRFRKYEDLPELTRLTYITAQRGMEWMSRDGIHLQSGRFLPGLDPSLAKATDDDSFRTQATAAAALARAAKYTGEEKYLVRASQTILSLLVETKIDPETPGVRTLPKSSKSGSRPGGTAQLAIAIYELPEAPPEAYRYAEELCQGLRLSARQDGAIGERGTTEEESTVVAGQTLLAIAMSNRVQPQPWKTDVLTAAFSYYRKEFQKAPSPGVIPALTAAYSEAYTQTKNATYAEFVFEMNDWLRNLQYDKVEGRDTAWRGGFMTVGTGKLVHSAPTIATADFAQSLADCCRMMRHMDRPDLSRYEATRLSLVKALQFVNGLQYADDNTQHFAQHFRPMLTGGFRPALNDGTLRVEHTASAITAFGKYLAFVAE